MTAERYEGLAQDLLDDWAAGLPVATIAKRRGIAHGTAKSYLLRAGVAVEPRRAKVVHSRRIAMPDDVAARYAAGESENAIAQRLGVSRNVVTIRLREAGIPRRGQREANVMTMAGRSDEEKARNAEAAHAAARGRVHTEEERCKQALTRERNCSMMGPDEAVLAQMLADRGIAGVPQKAIGRYNCDLACGPVAVEVFGGGFHFAGTHAARLPKRTLYLLDRGWSIIIVSVTQRWPLTDAGADNVAAFIEDHRRDPSRGREYRVIRGTGQFVAGGSADDDEITVVETLRCAKNRLGHDPR